MNAHLLGHRWPQWRRQNHFRAGIFAHGGAMQPFYQRRFDRGGPDAPELVFEQIGLQRQIQRADIFDLLLGPGATAQTPQSTPPISPAAQAMLDSLRLAVYKALERKRRLGQYAVIWQDGAPLLFGEDAPATGAATRKL